MVAQDFVPSTPSIRASSMSSSWSWRRQFWMSAVSLLCREGIIWLVVSIPLKKYEVNWDDDIPKWMCRTMYANYNLSLTWIKAIGYDSLNKHVKQIRLHPHENKENKESIVDALPVSIHYIEQRIEQIVPYNIVKNLDWMDWETRSKKKARLSYSDANQEPKRWCTLECFHRSQGSNSSHLLCEDRHILQVDTSCSQYCIFNTKSAKKGPIPNINKWCGWTILNN